MSEKNEKLTKKELRKFSLRYAITAQASQSYESDAGNCLRLFDGAIL